MFSYVCACFFRKKKKQATAADRYRVPGHWTRHQDRFLLLNVRAVTPGTGAHSTSPVYIISTATHLLRSRALEPRAPVAYPTKWAPRDSDQTPRCTGGGRFLPPRASASAVAWRVNSSKRGAQKLYKYKTTALLLLHLLLAQQQRGRGARDAGWWISPTPRRVEGRRRRRTGRAAGTRAAEEDRGGGREGRRGTRRSVLERRLPRVRRRGNHCGARARWASCGRAGRGSPPGPAAPLAADVRAPGQITRSRALPLRLVARSVGPVVVLGRVRSFAGDVGWGDVEVRLIRLVWLGPNARTGSDLEVARRYHNSLVNWCYPF